MLRQKLEDVVSNKIVTVLISDTQNIHNAERVVRDGKAVIFDY